MITGHRLWLLYQWRLQDYILVSDWEANSCLALFSQAQCWHTVHTCVRGHRPENPPPPLSLSSLAHSFSRLLQGNPKHSQTLNTFPEPSLCLSLLCVKIFKGTERYLIHLAALGHITISLATWSVQVIIAAFIKMHTLSAIRKKHIVTNEQDKDTGFVLTERSN